MPRLRYIEDSELTDETRGLIESARRTGAPDPRCVKIYVRNPKVGVAWVNYWNTLLYDGLLKHRLKDKAKRSKPISNPWPPATPASRRA